MTHITFLCLARHLLHIDFLICAAAVYTAKLKGGRPQGNALHMSRHLATQGCEDPRRDTRSINLNLMYTAKFHDLGFL